MSAQGNGHERFACVAELQPSLAYDRFDFLRPICRHGQPGRAFCRGDFFGEAAQDVGFGGQRDDLAMPIRLFEQDVQPAAAFLGGPESSGRAPSRLPAADEVRQ